MSVACPKSRMDIHVRRMPKNSDMNVQDTNRRATDLRRRRDSKILNRQQCAEWDTAGLECGSTALKSIHDANGMDDLAAKFFDSINSLQRTATGGDNVIDDHDSVTRLNRAFDVALGPVAFGFFANHEALHRAILRGGSDEHSANDRIRSDRHPAKASEFDVLQQSQQSVRNLHQSFGTERDLFAIQVVCGLLSGGQREVTKSKGSFPNQIH